MDEKNGQNTPEQNEELSNAARVLKATAGEDDAAQNAAHTPVHGNPIANFWYHHKWKVIVGGVFLFMGITLLTQFMGKSNPDITILYAGPDYITANDNRKFCAALSGIMDDYNGDGEKKVLLNDIIYMTGNQIRAAKAAAEENGDDFAYNQQANAQTAEQFTYEIMAGDSLLCFLCEDQYETVRDADGFVPLAEIFDEVPDYAVDAYGLRLSDTPFAQYFTICRIFPEETVVALRRVTTLSKVKGQEKMEKQAAWHRDLFEKIVNFTFPEGYTPETKVKTESEMVPE